MRNFIDLFEGRVEEISTQYGDLFVTWNPSFIQIKSLLDSSRDEWLRGLVTEDSIVVWDAYRAEHSQVANALGIEFKDRKKAFFIHRYPNDDYRIGPDVRSANIQDKKPIQKLLKNPGVRFGGVDGPLMEAPVVDYQLMGDWSDDESHSSVDVAMTDLQNDNNSFASKKDRRLIKSPENQRQLFKKLETFKYDIVFYFLNDKEQAKPFYRSLDFGLYDLDRKHKLFKEDTVSQLVKGKKKYPNAIHIVLTHNEGGEIRHPMTPWIIVHRMCHSLLGINGKDWVSDFEKIVSRFQQYINVNVEKTDDYYDQKVVHKLGDVAMSGLDFASARKNNILKIEGSDDPYFELWVEAFTQYVFRGEIKTKPLNRSLGGVDDDVEQAFLTMISEMEKFFEERLNQARGGIYVC